MASFYKNWGAIGGCTNFLSFGEFPEDEKDLETRWLPPGVIMKRDLANPMKFDPADIREHVAFSRLESADLNLKTLTKNSLHEASFLETLLQ
jgi:[NiFe] hydrogenase large subunit